MDKKHMRFSQEIHKMFKGKKYNSDLFESLGVI